MPFLVLLLPGPSSDPPLTAAAAALTVLVVAAMWVVPWGQVDARWSLLLALAYLVVVAVLREAGGGNSSGIGPMVMLPVIAMALVGTRGMLLVVAVGTGAVYWVPIVLDDSGTRYPEGGYRIGVLFVFLSALLGLAIQALRDQLRAQADVFERLAFVDGLTGLPNRRAWDDAAAAGLAVATRRQEPLCVAQIDIDAFKAVNDSGGHAAGDEILKRFATAWASSVRPGDVLARVGGDEFALLLPGCALPEAGQVVERLRVLAAQPTVSIGLVAWDRQESAEALLERADGQLYDAKRRGRNQVASDASPGIVSS